MARSEGRVIITLDRDFAEYFARTDRRSVGIIYLDLPNALRTIPHVSRLLTAFFLEHAASIELEHVLVTITDGEVRSRRG